jgi:predicted negative regulator of RcsB-dependent stress response
VDENLTDQQQAEVLRNWLKENAAFLIGGVLIGAGGLFGWGQYQQSRETYAEQASVLYEDIMQAVRQSRNDEAAGLVAALADDHLGSPYLDQSRLALAKLQLDRNEPEAAAEYLQQIVDAASSVDMRYIASLRLARVRIHQQQYDAALKTLENGDPNSAFAPRYHDVRGDVYLAMGQVDQARNEYLAALSAEDTGVIARPLVQAKLDALTVAEISSVDMPALEDIALEDPALEDTAPEDAGD